MKRWNGWVKQVRLVLGSWRQKVDIKGYDNPFPTSEEEIGQKDVAIEEDAILRECIRAMIVESELENLARAFSATSPGDKSLVGDIGEEIAQLYHPGENLNDTKKNTQFPFADVVGGSTDDLENAEFYSVKATSERPKTKSGKYTHRDVFGNSMIKGPSIASLVNKRGNKGIRDEIDQQFKGADEIELNLGAIGLNISPDKETGAPNKVNVVQYGPEKFKFQKNDDDLYVGDVMKVAKMRSAKQVRTNLGGAKELEKGGIQVDPDGLQKRKDLVQRVRANVAKLPDKKLTSIAKALEDLGD